LDSQPDTKASNYYTSTRNCREAEVRLKSFYEDSKHHIETIRIIVAVAVEGYRLIKSA